MKKNYLIKFWHRPTEMACNSDTKAKIITVNLSKKQCDDQIIVTLQKLKEQEKAYGILLIDNFRAKKVRMKIVDNKVYKF